MRVRRTLSPLVAITQNNDESFAIEEGLNLLNISSMINSNDVVVITPNWVGAGGPEIGDVVGPNSLKKIIQIIKSCNPKRIVIATASARKDVEKLMIDIGFMDVIKSENVEFINLNNGPFINLPLNHSCPKSIALNKLYDEMTFLISFTQLKIH